MPIKWRDGEKIISGAILSDSVEISLCSELKTMNELIKKRITE